MYYKIFAQVGNAPLTQIDETGDEMKAFAWAWFVSLHAQSVSLKQYFTEEDREVFIEYRIKDGLLISTYKSKGQTQALLPKPIQVNHDFVDALCLKTASIAHYLVKAQGAGIVWTFPNLKDAAMYAAATDGAIRIVTKLGKMIEIASFNQGRITLKWEPHVHTESE